MLLALYLALFSTAVYWVVKILGPEMSKPSFNLNVNNETDHGAEKLRILLIERNKNIQVLQTELKILQGQVQNFNLIKTILEEEIHRLREQNHIFRSELGMPAAQSKENSTT